MNDKTNPNINHDSSSTIAPPIPTTTTPTLGIVYILATVDIGLNSICNYKYRNQRLQYINTLFRFIQIQLIMYNCRFISDALYHLYGIKFKLVNCHDIAVYQKTNYCNQQEQQQ